MQCPCSNRYDWKAVSCVAAPNDDDQRQYLSFGIGPYNLNDDGRTVGNSDATERYLTATLQLVENANCTAVNENAIPACLWRDLNRTPYYGQEVHFDGQAVSARDKNVVHNRDCKLFTSHTELTIDQLCWQEFRLRPDGTDAPNCGRKGDPLITLQRTNNIYLPYLVGLYSHDRQCAGGEPIVATRISSYINWISLYM
ncbi:AGAP009006-PA-like protein [Anopheles sinensis]|uniref:AGAP009006-PA-like protein n=1 Tax=Anopheles sinensis TaxID=74873 RepID=A0A084VKF1_ANOSI|nr:AGAP009006-PA-like protein [Anopheles sinensis]